MRKTLTFKRIHVSYRVPFGIFFCMLGEGYAQKHWHISSPQIFQLQSNTGLCSSAENFNYS
jgi:hypothetical protein